MVFLAKSVQGKLDWGSPYNEARLRQYLKLKEGKIFRLEDVPLKRTLSQNSYYWAYLAILERETGNNAEEMHEYFRRKLLPPKFIKVLGKEIRIPRSTTELNKSDFGEYLDKISALVEVPLPDPKLLKGYIPK